VVPYWHGTQLYDLAPNKGWFVELPGADHNDLFIRPHIEHLRLFLHNEVKTSVHVRT
jgi:hypothetical protein